MGPAPVARQPRLASQCARERHVSAAVRTDAYNELLFIPQGVLRPDRAAFERYFAARDHYTVKKGHARYENEDTGVDFSFEDMPDPAARPSAGASPWADVQPRARPAVVLCRGGLD